MSGKLSTKTSPGRRKSTAGSSKKGGSGKKKTPTDSRSAMERDQSQTILTGVGRPGTRSAQSHSSASGSMFVDRAGDERVPSPDLTALRNPAADPRTMRRIIAEDPDWSLATVPCLTDLCINSIVASFDNNSTVLNKLEQKQRARVLELIPTSLPVKVTARLVDDDGYWKKCCRARWERCDVTQHGGRWKRMFFERNLQDIIETFIPETTDPTELHETLTLSANYVRRLIVRQLLPPIREPVKGRGGGGGGGGDGDGSDAGLDEILVEHFDFGTILPSLPFLEELQVHYGVRNCGMNFDWTLFQFTTRDCQLLSRSVADCRTLRSLTLTQSKVDDDKIRMLIGQIIDHPVLEQLDLSQNIIGDRGARAIGKFLNGHSQLTELNLCANCIGPVGAQAVAHALIKNTMLTSLNLRLNHIGDDGGQAICRALLKNNTLTEIVLAGDDLMEPTAAAMAAVLQVNSTLKYIDLSCNKIGNDGGKQLQEGIEENKTVTYMDLRFTECGQESEFCIQQALNRNRDRERVIANNSIRY